MGLGLTLVLVVLGGMRELVGQGTLLSGIDLVFGEAAKALRPHVLPDYQGFLLAILPPGAFIALGLLIAAQELASRRVAAQRARNAVADAGMKPPLKKRVPKPRNPYIALALAASSAGEHEKSASAKRQAEKQALNKSLETQ